MSKRAIKTVVEKPKSSEAELMLANALVAKTESGKDLTDGERSTVSGLVAEAANGNLVKVKESARMQLEKSSTMRDAFLEAMGKLGIGMDFLATKLKDGLEATIPKYMRDAGGAIERFEDPDFDARHKYLGSALAVMGLGDRTKTMHVERESVVYRSLLRGDAQEIAVEGPQTETGRRRLAAQGRARIGMEAQGGEA